MRINEVILTEKPEGTFTDEPNIFKAVFMAGTPASGKGHVHQNLFGGEGLRIIDSDKVFELLMDKEGLRKDMPPEEQEQRDDIRTKAKKLTGTRKRNFLQERRGIVIDGTAKDFDKIKGIKGRLESIGYDTIMVFVFADLKTTIERNASRYAKGGRKVPHEILTKTHAEIEQNVESFRNLFGQGYFFVMDNSEEENKTQHNAKIQNNQNEKNIRQWLNMAPKKPAAIAWQTIRQAGGTGYPLAHPSVRGSREQQGRPVVQDPKQQAGPDHSPSISALASMTG
jgi:predicted ABC-type ATPase